MRLEQEVSVGRRIRGVSSPALLVLGPLWILLAERWLFCSAPLLVFFCLSLLLIVSFGLVLISRGLATESDGRLLTRYGAAGSLTLGVVLLPFCLQDLNTDGFRRSQVERLIARCESALDPAEVRSEFACLKHHDYTLLSPEDHRRAAIQKGRFGDWNGADLLWILDGSSIYTDEQRAVAGFISKLRREGVSQFTLKGLCIQLFWMGYEKQSVNLWRSHYPMVIPEDWKRALQDY